MTRLKIRWLFTSFLLALLLIRLVSFWSAKSQRLYVNKAKVDFVAVVESEPFGQSFKIGDFRVTTAKTGEWHFGDKVELKGVVSCPQKQISCANPNLYYPSISIVEAKNPLRAWWQAASAARSKVIVTYQSVLPPVEADLFSGIVLGSQGLNRELRSKLADTGLTHVVAASGMNVSLFSGMILWLLTQLRGGLKVKILVGLGFIWFYATLTGFEPPIVRAALMASFTLVAMASGRPTTGYSGLLLAAVLMLWVSPELLVSPSFLLSFSSMIGQIFLSGVRVDLPKLVTPIIEVFLQSLVAIAFTFPIVVIFFSRFSLMALFTNPLVLWTIEPLMVLGGLMATLGLFFTPISQALAILAQGLLEFFLWVVNFFSQTSWTTVHISFVDNTTALLFAVGYYLLLTSVILYTYLNLAMKDSRSRASGKKVF